MVIRLEKAAVDRLPGVAPHFMDARLFLEIALNKLFRRLHMRGMLKAQGNRRQLSVRLNYRIACRWGVAESAKAGRLNGYGREEDTTGECLLRPKPGRSSVHTVGTPDHHLRYR